MNVEVDVVNDEELALLHLRGQWKTKEWLLNNGMQILKKDKFICQGCGFESSPTPEHPDGLMIPINREHSAYLPVTEEGHTLCAFCFASIATNISTGFLLNDRREDKKIGYLVRIPVLKQHELNLVTMLCNAIIYQEDSASQDYFEQSLVESARSFMLALKGNSSSVNNSLPFPDVSEEDYMRAVALLPNDLNEFRKKALNQYRWLPNYEAWGELGAYMAKHVLQSQVSQLLDKVKKAITVQEGS